MCRLLGVVSAEVIDHDHALCASPQSLADLSPEHPHGWGLALHGGQGGWDIHKSPACAKDDPRFHALSRSARGSLLIAHVRKRTVGPTSLANTHPFHSGRWVFAHNGTLHDPARLDRHTSIARCRAVAGDTDSERLFAYLLTSIDLAGGTHGARRAAPGAVDAALRAAVADLCADPGFGAANFLLSDGDVLYAHRHGRTLHIIERRGLVMLASEVLADGTAASWQEITDGTLLRIDAGRQPQVRWLARPEAERAARIA